MSLLLKSVLVLCLSANVVFAGQPVELYDHSSYPPHHHHGPPTYSWPPPKSSSTTSHTSSSTSSSSSPTSTIDGCYNYVNQLIGDENGGNVFPGATLPYGMVKAVADTDGGSEGDNTGGFSSDGSPIIGFSHLHDSGTGGTPSLGNFPLFPYAGCPDDQIDNCKFPKATRAQSYYNNTVVATPGYFELTLNSSVNAKMSVTNHTALYKFTFPKKPLDGSPLSPLILVDLSDLGNSRMNGTVNVTSSGRMSGFAEFLPSFGSGSFVSYFCVDFQGATVRDNGIFVNNRAGTGEKNLFITQGINGYPLPGGAFQQFNPPTTSDNSIMARVGMSFISVAQACSNAEKEIPDFNLNTVKTNAENAWKQKLSPVSFTPGPGVATSQVVNFCSSIYRTMISPQDYTGENPLWTSTLPYYDSYYCIWDMFRVQLPLLTIIDPYSEIRIVNSLLNIYQHQGWLPDCRMSLCKGFTQGGSNADVVLADAYVKNLPGIDYKLAYAAVVQDAEVEPIDWSNEGRGGLMSWHSLGYIPAEDFDYIGFGTYTRSISRTLEYAYNDFCVATLARANGDTAGYDKYIQRASNWKNLYDAKQTSFINGTNTGFQGFFQPKFLNQTFGFQDPITCSNLPDTSNVACSLQNDGQETFESSIWEYSFFTPGTMSELIAIYGGPETFVNRLNYLHNEGITYIGNEPAFLTVFQFHYAGRPALSAHRSHFYVESMFLPTTDGLPGNDDSGAMGAFVAFNYMGLFPNPGQDVYLIIPPYFESVSVKSPLTGKTATVRNINFDSTYKNIYIQSATLNGQPYTKNWLTHDFFTSGGELVLTLGPKESSWGTAEADLPPSVTTS